MTRNQDLIRATGSIIALVMANISRLDRCGKGPITGPLGSSAPSGRTYGTTAQVPIRVIVELHSL